MFEDTIGGANCGGHHDTSETLENQDGTGENYRDVLNAAIDFKSNVMIFINDK